MAKTQCRRKMSRRSRNKSRSLKGGTKASSKSHIAAAAAPASSLAIHKRPDESATDFLERLKKQVAYIASLKKPAGVKKPEKTLTEEEKAMILQQRKVAARNEEFRSAAHSRPHASGTAQHAAYLRAAASARGNPHPQ
jgi:hypothetical protein